MPVHDWSTVPAGAFHAFHTSWITHLSEALNAGLLPEGYYALPEQHAGRYIADLLTLQGPVSKAPPDAKSTDKPYSMSGSVALADAPPQVQQHLRPKSSTRSLRRSLAIRHVSQHQIIALLEIISPGNKNRKLHLSEFLHKATDAIEQGIHLLVVDLFPPGDFDPHGIPALIWEHFESEAYEPVSNDPLNLSSYRADINPEFYIEPLAVGSTLIAMPLFLNLEYYINVPLEATYQQAFEGMPAYYRDMLNSK